MLIDEKISFHAEIANKNTPNGIYQQDSLIFIWVLSLGTGKFYKNKYHHKTRCPMATWYDDLLFVNLFAQNLKHGINT